MQSPHLFWPADRKLFRQRSRGRLLAPAIAAVVVVAILLGLPQLGIG